MEWADQWCELDLGLIGLAVMGQVRHHHFCPLRTQHVANIHLIELDLERCGPWYARPVKLVLSKGC